MSNKRKLKFKEIINSNKPVLVDFYATWCGPCQQLSPIVNEVKRELGTNMRVIKIDVDKKQSLSKKYKVKSLPTLAIFQNGEILWRATGMKTKNELLNITSQFIKKSPQLSGGETDAPAEKTSWFGRLFKKS